MKLDYSKFGYVYRTTNLINSKTYIGKHRIKENEVWAYYLGSGRAIANAIKKYGRESFVKELIVYAKDDEELNSLENHYINLEIKNNPNCYNILSADSETLNARFKADLNMHPILDWYFEEKLSTTEIAERLGCSQPTIHAYLKLFRESDERFKDIVQGARLTRKGSSYVRTKEMVDKYRKTMANKPKVLCEKCKETFTSSGFSLHKDFCSNRVWPKCEICNVRLSKKSAKKCLEHKYTKT